MSSSSEPDFNLADASQCQVEDWESQLDTEFVVDLNYLGIDIEGNPIRREGVYPTGSVLKLRLVEVKRLKPMTMQTPREPFSLLFRGPHELPMFSENHVLIHDSLGTLSLFLSPVSVEPGIHPEQHPDGRFYESIFG